MLIDLQMQIFADLGPTTCSQWLYQVCSNKKGMPKLIGCIRLAVMAVSSNDIRVTPAVSISLTICLRSLYLFLMHSLFI